MRDYKEFQLELKTVYINIVVLNASVNFIMKKLGKFVRFFVKAYAFQNIPILFQTCFLIKTIITSKFFVQGQDI